MFWFEYALIRYIPNPKRGETINIGLIVFKEGDADIRVLDSVAKVRMIDGKTSQKDLFGFQESIRKLAGFASTPEEQYSLLSNFDNNVFLSSKGQFALDDLKQYESKVTRLFRELVKPFSMKNNEIKMERLTTELKHKFESMQILAKDHSELTKHKVCANYPINEAMGLRADFVLKNGIFHVTETVDFNVNDLQSKLKETSFKMLTFMQSKTVFDNPACYFVYSASAAKDKVISQHLAVAEGYSTKLFNLESKEEQINYFEMIARHTGTSLPTVH